MLQEIFQLIVTNFKGLDDVNSPSFSRRVSILETVAKVRSCVVMLDLECDDLILEMFEIFFATARCEPIFQLNYYKDTYLQMVLVFSSAFFNSFFSAGKSLHVFIFCGYPNMWK